MHAGAPDRKLGAALAPRELSPFDATMLVMGGIVGVGIFFTPARVAALVPDARLFLCLWALGGAVALCGALTFAELGSAFPREGGWYVFLREAFGPFTAFLFAWIVLSVISTAAVAAMMSFLTDTLRTLWPAIGPPGSAGTIAVGTGAVLLLTALSIAGAKVGATFQNGCMLLKLAAVLAIVAGSFLVLRLEPAGAQPVAPAAGTLGRGMVQGILPVLFTCGGWQMLCYVAPLVRDPRRTLPRAIVVGVVGVVVVYLAANGAYLRTLGIEGLAGDGAFASRVADATLGPAGSVLLRSAMIVSALGVCTVTIVATPWLYVAMAREGLFFARFAELSPRTGAPVLALCVQAALCLLYWVWAQAGPAGGVTPDVLVSSVAFVEWVFHVLVAWACLRLRRTRADVPRPFRAWTIAPLCYLAFALAVVGANLAGANWTDMSIGLALLAVGAVVYLSWRRHAPARVA